MDIRVVICIYAVAQKTVHRLVELREHMLNAPIIDGNLSCVIIGKCVNKMIPNHSNQTQFFYNTLLPF